MEPNIYEDLDKDCLTLDQQIEKVQQENLKLLATIGKLEKTSKTFSKEIIELKHVKTNLETNISTLFKTAKLEIQRKDRQIADLRKEVDDLIFKRIQNNKLNNFETLQKDYQQAKIIIEEKCRIINSLNRELENRKKESETRKRSASHSENKDSKKQKMSESFKDKTNENNYNSSVKSSSDSLSGNRRDRYNHNPRFVSKYSDKWNDSYNKLRHRTESRTHSRSVLTTEKRLKDEGAPHHSHNSHYKKEIIQNFNDSVKDQFTDQELELKRYDLNNISSEKKRSFSRSLSRSTHNHSNNSSSKHSDEKSRTNIHKKRSPSVSRHNLPNKSSIPNIEENYKRNDDFTRPDENSRHKTHDKKSSDKHLKHGHSKCEHHSKCSIEKELQNIDNHKVVDKKQHEETKIIKQNMFHEVSKIKYKNQKLNLDDSSEKEEGEVNSDDESPKTTTESRKKIEIENAHTQSNIESKINKYNSLKKLEENDFRIPKKSNKNIVESLNAEESNKTIIETVNTEKLSKNIIENVSTEKSNKKIIESMNTEKLNKNIIESENAEKSIKNKLEREKFEKLNKIMIENVNAEKSIKNKESVNNKKLNKNIMESVNTENLLNNIKNANNIKNTIETENFYKVPQQNNKTEITSEEYKTNELNINSFGETKNSTKIMKLIEKDTKVSTLLEKQTEFNANQLNENNKPTVIKLVNLTNKEKQPAQKAANKIEDSRRSDNKPEKKMKYDEKYLFGDMSEDDSLDLSDEKVKVEIDSTQQGKINDEIEKRRKRKLEKKQIHFLTTVITKYKKNIKKLENVLGEKRNNSNGDNEPKRKKKRRREALILKIPKNKMKPEPKLITTEDNTKLVHSTNNNKITEISLAAVETSSAAVETSPAAVKTSPAAVETSPAAVETSPAAVETSPAAVETSPAAVETSPAAVETSPTAVETSPAAVETSPVTVETSPAADETSPAAVETTLAPVETSTQPTAHNDAQTPPPAIIPEANVRKQPVRPRRRRRCIISIS